MNRQLRLKWIFRLLLVFVLIVLLSAVVYAQTPVVYGVFFYTPTCPHCHEVMTNHWPQIQDEFDDQLQVLFIDVSKSRGNQIMWQARAALNIESSGVPMLIIGSEVLLGSFDIPYYTPMLVRSGLNNGGIGMPPIPGIEALYQAAVGQSASNSAAIGYIPTENISLLERLVVDPLANGLAIMIFTLLTFSLVVTLLFKGLIANIKRRTLIALALLGLGLSISLLAGWNNAPGILLLAAGIFVTFLAFVFVIWRLPKTQPTPQWFIPLTAAAGLVVAGYLSYVEVTLSEAVCGVVGDCNIVQQSEYARIFGIPVGILGILGYFAVLLIWVVGRDDVEWTRRILFVIALVGVVFSTYLTFLEPFVIGASCAWCLTSAVLMLMLLWMVSEPPRATLAKKRAVRRA